MARGQRSSSGFMRWMEDMNSRTRGRHWIWCWNLISVGREVRGGEMSRSVERREKREDLGTEVASWDDKGSRPSARPSVVLGSATYPCSFSLKLRGEGHDY